jgi:hypothetical protein
MNPLADRRSDENPKISPTLHKYGLETFAEETMEELKAER